MEFNYLEAERVARLGTLKQKILEIAKTDRPMNTLNTPIEVDGIFYTVRFFSGQALLYPGGYLYRDPSEQITAVFFDIENKEFNYGLKILYVINLDEDSVNQVEHSNTKSSHRGLEIHANTPLEGASQLFAAYGPYTRTMDDVGCILARLDAGYYYDALLLVETAADAVLQITNQQ